MGRYLILFLLLSIFPSFTFAQSNSSQPESAAPFSAVDKTANPCADFFQYSCGNWLKTAKIPPDQSSWGTFPELLERNETIMKGILEKAAANNPERDSIDQKIGDYYESCMDEKAVDAKGFEPLKPELDRIAGVKDKQSLIDAIARVHMIGPNPLFSFYSQPDLHDANMVIAYIDQGGLSLPDREYYLKDDAHMIQIRGQYVEYVTQVFSLAGQTPEQAAESAKTVLRIETALAKAAMDRTARRDPKTRDHKMSSEEASQLAANFELPRFFADVNAPKISNLNVSNPEFFKQVNQLLESEPLDAWKTYVSWHLLDGTAPWLSKPFVDANFKMEQAITGQSEIKPRWKRCVAAVDDELGEALGQRYVEQTFGADGKQRMLKMVEALEKSLSEDIQNLSWMSDETKKQAHVKLSAIRNKIGYPDKWRDYSSIKLSRDNFFSDIQGTTEFESHRQINKIGKPVDHGEWQVPPPTVDAYYDPQMNDINFPAGVLQPPLYDPKTDAAPNYGNTGGTIGHELTHGFDDEGSQFDAKGNLRNWWTKEDREKFDSRTKCVRGQYAQYIVVDNIHINSALTLGEDVADLGGEILAYMAWKDATKGQNLQTTDGLTPDQRFFIGFAQWDCANQRPEDLRVSAVTNPHSPPEHRINGVVVNMPEFANAFSCKQGQPMTKAPEKICKVW